MNKSSRRTIAETSYTEWMILGRGFRGGELQISPLSYHALPFLICGEPKGALCSMKYIHGAF
jgi:hypothetical protein